MNPPLSYLKEKPQSRSSCVSSHTLSSSPPYLLSTYTQDPDDDDDDDDDGQAFQVLLEALASDVNSN
jgi:hypothetical protein